MKPLSPFEIRALELSAQGYFQSEIAEIVGRSKRTIECQLVSARKKLGARTIVQAIAISMRRDLISTALCESPARERAKGFEGLDG